MPGDADNIVLFVSFAALILFMHFSIILLPASMLIMNSIRETTNTHKSNRRLTQELFRSSISLQQLLLLHLIVSS